MGHMMLAEHASWSQDMGDVDTHLFANTATS